MVYDITEDNQGRVLIPAELKEYAKIDKDIVITGAASYLRIESAEAFAAKNANVSVSSVFAKLNALRSPKA